MPEEAQKEPQSPKEEAKQGSSSGLQSNIAGALCYFLGFLTGILFLMIQKEDKFVRFHAWQSIIFSVVWIVISFVVGLIPVIGWIIALILPLVIFVLWLFLMYKAYNKEEYKLPIIGDFAEQQANKV